MVSEALRRVLVVPDNAVTQWASASINVSTRRHISTGRCVLAAGFLIGLCGNVHAQAQTAPQQPATTVIAANGAADTTGEIVRRYPLRSINSETVAAAALGDIAHQRIALEAMQKREQQACMPTFFTTSCLDKVREQHRHELGRLRPIELEANAFNRRNRVAERDRALDAKRVRTEQDAATGKGEVNIRAPAVPASPAMPHHIPAPRQSKPLTQRIDAAEQARNEAAFDRKAVESAQRQRQIAEKKAEKESDRAKKKAAAAAVPATP